MDPQLTMQALLSLKRDYPRPDGLIRIVLNGSTNGEIRPNRRAPHSRNSRQPQNKRRGGGGGSGSNPHQRGWSRGPALQHSENSFSAARVRMSEQPQAKQIIGEIRGLLNKVTTENFDAIREEIYGSELIKYAKTLDDDEEGLEDFLQEIAKLFVNKSKVDHEFSGLYAEMASHITKEVDMFGDVLYEVCRDAIPTTRYDPDRKRGYLGSLLLLVEMRRVDITSSGGILAFVDRLVAAIERCNPDTVFSVQQEEPSPSDVPIDPAKQVEVCIELLCKFLPAFLSIERPDWVHRYLDQLRELQTMKDRIKPRCRFMLMDFFKEIAEDPKK